MMSTGVGDARNDAERRIMRREDDAAVTPDCTIAIDAMGRAAMDRRRWPEALDAIVRFIGARFAALIFEDADSALLELRHSTRAEKTWICDYLRRHGHLDSIRARLIRTVGTGAVFAARDFVPSGRFERSDAYQRWLEPHGLVDIIGAVLHRSDKGACLFVALLDREADAVARERLLMLTPHLAAAIAGGAPAGDADASMTELFDRLAEPIVVVGEGLRIRFANPAGREEMARGTIFAEVAGALVVKDPHAQDALMRRMGACGRNVRTSAIMSREGADRSCVIHNLPLSKGAALLLRDLSPGPTDAGDVAAGLYGLAARERSVLLAIAEVGGAPATARALGLTEGTMRGYLKSIFHKTGARRQVELVRLALSLRSPFRSDEPKAAVDVVRQG
jgi:DNA-binding CsgD family transcriptional regulator